MIAVIHVISGVEVESETLILALKGAGLTDMQKKS